MRRRGIRADIERRAAQQIGGLAEAKAANEIEHRHAALCQHLAHIVALFRRTAARDDDPQVALVQPLEETAPAPQVPAFVAKARREIDHGVRIARGVEAQARTPLRRRRAGRRRDHLRVERQRHRGGKAGVAVDSLLVRRERDAPREKRHFPPARERARREKTHAPRRGERAVQVRTVAGFGDHREIVAAPQTSHERCVLGETRPRCDCQDAPYVGIAFEYLAGSFGEQHVDRRGVDTRGRERE